MSAEPAKDPPNAHAHTATSRTWVSRYWTSNMPRRATDGSCWASASARTRNPPHTSRAPATGTHRVVNSCRGGHSETIEVHTREELHAAMVSGCRVVMPDGRPCRALVNVSRHINGAGVELGMIWIPDPKTPPDSDREAAR